MWAASLRHGSNSTISTGANVPAEAATIYNFRRRDQLLQAVRSWFIGVATASMTITADLGATENIADTKAGAFALALFGVPCVTARFNLIRYHNQAVRVMPGVLGQSFSRARRLSLLQ